MRRIHLLIAAGALAAASAVPAVAASWGYGISYGPGYGPGPYYYGYRWAGPAYYPRAYYAPRYYYPRYAYAYPAPPVYYAYSYPPRTVYVERYVEPAPPPSRLVPPPAETMRPEIPPARLAAIPPQRLEKMTLSATELFEFDKATLREPQPKLDQMARALKDNPDIASVAITGYADRLGTDEYNLSLSRRRAEAVKSYLVKQGVAAGRLSAVGKGEKDPVVQCNDKDRTALIKCLEPNRRVEVEQITVEKKTRSGLL
jgi:OOP family OmpA-OmpF porin